jgi:hypothetical protein
MIRFEFVLAWPDRVERYPLELPDGAVLAMPEPSWQS